jgi:hypothetical protein
MRCTRGFSGESQPLAIGETTIQFGTHCPVPARSDGPSCVKVRRTVLLTVDRTLCNLSIVKRSEVEWANEMSCKAPSKC